MQKTWRLTQEQVADELGLSRDQMAQALRVLTFPTDLQKLVSHDTITQTHAETLARLRDSPKLLQEATKKVLDAHLTTEQTEQLVKDMLERRQPKFPLLMPHPWWAMVGMQMPTLLKA